MKKVILLLLPVILSLLSGCPDPTNIYNTICDDPSHTTTTVDCDDPSHAPHTCPDPINCPDSSHTTTITYCPDPSHTPHSCPTCDLEHVTEPECTDGAACAEVTSDWVEKMDRVLTERCEEKGCLVIHRTTPKGVGGTAVIQSWMDRLGGIHITCGDARYYYDIVPDAYTGKIYPCLNDADRQKGMTAALAKQDEIHGIEP